MIHAVMHSRKTLPPLIRLTSTDFRTRHTPLLPFQSISSYGQNRKTCDAPYPTIHTISYTNDTTKMLFRMIPIKARTRRTPAFLFYPIIIKASTRHYSDKPVQMIHAISHSRKTFPSLLQMTSTNARTRHARTLPF
ncbi:MAG: hypothetical protein ACRC9E_10825 [Plesiomonas shigelloides]